MSEVIHDSVPIPRGACNPPEGADPSAFCGDQGNDCDGTIGKATCRPGRVTLGIAFSRDEQVGDFVYHCHILEHEDRGMMGLVHVIGRKGAAARHTAMEHRHGGH
ncbi:MAG TPA: multicopper oxidase domain-containing protein [Rhodoblastus sp.]|nr:multicopper oxidase domain-containing protein [Rhodoblastus sp.]